MEPDEGGKASRPAARNEPQAQGRAEGAPAPADRSVPPVPGVHVIVQARLGSSRLPGKVLEEIEGKPMLLRVLERAGRIPGVERVILATTEEPEDAVLMEAAARWGTASVAGSTDDVLARFLKAARVYGSRVVVRVTADCPLYDPAVGGLVLRRFLEEGTLDYASNAHPPTYPDGLDTEVISIDALEQAGREARLSSEREHVTAFIWKRPERFRIANLEHERDLSRHRWTVDEPEDLALVREVHRRLGSRAESAGLQDILALFEADPALEVWNATIGRDEGYHRSVARDQGTVARDEGPDPIGDPDPPASEPHTSSRPAGNPEPGSTEGNER